ncbi:MAG TPA: nitronate monooxygenase [Caulobacteraceae bacterium]|jgi:nitronate monooxygenase
MRGDPKLASALRARLRLPVFAGPMFIASTADLVIAQSKAGIIGAMPALNPRSTAALDEDIARIAEALSDDDAPYAINLVAHRTNDRLAADLQVVLKHRVPIVVLALAADGEIVKTIHEYGGVVFNDVINNRQALKCADRGVDGLIAVCAGAGGHTGKLSPFALMNEIRDWWAGPLALSGCIATGRDVLAAEVMGADFAYIGSPFLASDEANTQPAFKQMIVDSTSSDIVVTNCFTGVDASFLRPSIEFNGLDPANLVRAAGTQINIKDGGSNAKAWRDIWSAGQGIGAVKRSGPAAQYIGGLAAEYAAAKAALR